MFSVSKKAKAFPATDVCVACLECPPDTRLLPCGHVVTCSRCLDNAARAGLQRRCFLCRQVVTSSKRIGGSASRSAAAAGSGGGSSGHGCVVA